MTDCCCSDLKTALPSLKQGDGCFLAATVYFNGAAVTENELPLLESLEYCFEDDAPRTVRADEAFSPALGAFLLPVAQTQTHRLETGRAKLDLRVKFRGGNVLGARRKAVVRVLGAASGEVL